MAFPRRLLNQGEEVVLDLNPHWIALAPSGLALVATIVLGIVVWAGWNPDPGSLGGKIVYVLVALLILAALVYFLARLAVWRTTHFVVTSTRLIAGHGVLSKTRKEIPLDRVNDVSFHQGLLERLVGAGDLTVESAGERGQSTFQDVNHPDHVQAQIYAQMEAREQRRFAPQTAPPQLADAAPPVTAPAPPVAVAGGPGGTGQGSIADQIAELHDLMTRGVISEAEFEAKKAQLLDRM
ncbi:MAG TPA: PH domain-containing protein [Acidimicrobiales bacterium]|jgi:membrane protein YdbS with pleckstrin-like domain|nr:PH domain-containing protein [Acidimicrobiales bacterium]